VEGNKVLHYKSLELIFIRLFSFITSYRLPKSGLEVLNSGFEAYFSTHETSIRTKMSRRMQEKYDKLRRNINRLCRYTLANDKLEIYDLLEMLKTNKNKWHGKLLSSQKWQV